MSDTKTDMGISGGKEQETAEAAVPSTVKENLDTAESDNTPNQKENEAQSPQINENLEEDEGNNEKNTDSEDVNEEEDISPQDKELISLILGSKLADKEMLTKAIRESNGSIGSLQKIILRDGLLTEDQLGMLKAHAYGWYFIDISNEPLNTSLLNYIPLKVAESQQTIPFSKEEDGIHIACLNHQRGPFFRLLRKKFGPRLTFFLTTTGSFNAAIAQYDTDFQEKCAEILERSKSTSTVIGSREDTTITELFDTLVQHALRENASDIHIEPQKKSVVIRERVDGILHRILEFSHDVHDRLTQRVKLLAYMPIDEHSIPLDGKIVHESESGSQTDIRVSTVPTRYGEKIVCRLLRSDEMRLPLESLGVSNQNMEILEKEMKRAWGMILLTGPTGSGKTSTLYAILRRLNEEKVNISTVEDPVEYELIGANQIQINTKANLTFSSGLRALLRQDPDIILVGEIRDSETAGIAVNAAMTGHMVLSTLHTNDAPTALPRLRDMGIEPFLIYSTVNIIVAQRLVRKICVRCRHSVRVKIEDQDYASMLPDSAIQTLKSRGDPTLLFKGKGCDRCNGTGYSGRTGIHEFLPVNEAIKDLILNNADSDTISEAARANGMKTMFEDGIQKVLQGETTIEEVLRVSRTQ